MRNHDEKARDMARSVLPSTARRRARRDRAAIRARERARLRHELHAVRSLPDPDDYEGDLLWQARRDVHEMVWDRRSADKVGPLVRWATRTIESDEELAAASFEARLDHFRRVLPVGLIGNHALQHLGWAIDERPRWPARRRRGPLPPPASLVDMVEAIVAEGAHGELNRRLRAEVPAWTQVWVVTPARRVVDVEHPAPGVLVPRSSGYEIRPRPVRFLAGAHDVAAFARDVARTGRGEVTVVRELYDGLSALRSR